MTSVIRCQGMRENGGYAKWFLEEVSNLAVSKDIRQSVTVSSLKISYLVRQAV